MSKWKAGAVVVLFGTTSWSSSAVAQNNGDQVQGAEYVAAVNLPSKNVTAEGRIFVPESAGRVNALLVLVNVYHGLEIFADAEWRRLTDRCRCATLNLQLRSIRPLLGD